MNQKEFEFTCAEVNAFEPDRFSLGQKRLNESFEYNNGFLFWKKVSKHNHRLLYQKAGTVMPDGYRMIYFDLGDGRKNHQAHRLIWILFCGDIPDGYVVDHKDGNNQNNDIFNLRLATRSQNNFNRKRKKYCGISFSKECPLRPWVARIYFNGKTIRHFCASREEALEVRKQLELKHFGRFARHQNV